jgi:predicted nucleic acid-binding Zn ribbon protein
MSENEKEKTRKPYVFPHKHCPYCGRMIDVKGRQYCLKCKPEYEKEQAKTSRSKRMQRFFVVYIVIIVILLGAVLLVLR